MPRTGPEAPDNFDDLVFRQDLNEVYLLLDYISGRPDRQLSELDGRIADPCDAARKLSAGEVVERVGRLRYPPDQPPREKARDAAFLLTLKDALNSLAYPARGMTVAYTTMFAEEPLRGRTHRVSTARLAFPDLIGGAASFRRLKSALSWGGALVTVASAILLWQVTYGVQLAARFDEAKRNDTGSAARVYAQAERESRETPAAMPELLSLCRIPRTDGAPQDPPAQDRRSAAMRLACDDYAYRRALLCVAIADIGDYGESPLFGTYRWLLPMHALKPGERCARDDAAPGMGRQEDAQSIAGVLAMMSNYLLPILFGLIGTLTALVRGIQDKVTESVLAPRDRALALIRLPLGMVAGVSVGLFFNPSGFAAQAGSIGAFTISASGIAFLAGYGAEGFFRALDGMIARLFTPEGGARPAR